MKSVLNIQWKDWAEAPILWPPEVKSQYIGKDPDAGKDQRQEKGATEDEMVGWHHWLGRDEFGQTQIRWRTGKLGVMQSMGSQSRTWLSNWTITLSTLITIQEYLCLIFLSWLLVIMWFLSIPAEINQAPFYLTKGESELISGFNSEHVAGLFALFFLAEYSNITIINIFFTILFIGAFHNPHNPEIYSILLPKSSS